MLNRFLLLCSVPCLNSFTNGFTTVTTHSFRHQQQQRSLAPRIRRTKLFGYANNTDYEYISLEDIQEEEYEEYEAMRGKEPQSAPYDEVSAGKRLRQQLIAEKRQRESSENTIDIGVPEPPISIRGEAIRSGIKAIPNGICFRTPILYDHDDSSNSEEEPVFRNDPYLIKITGNGAYSFCNGKLMHTIQAASSSASKYTRTYLLNRKGYVVDAVHVAAATDNEIYLVPSTNSYDLFTLLDATVFPMDEVRITKKYIQDSYVLASSAVPDSDDAEQVGTWESYMNQYYSMQCDDATATTLPNTLQNECAIIDLKGQPDSDTNQNQLLILPNTGLSSIATPFGYSVYQLANTPPITSTGSNAAFAYFTSEQCSQGPIPVQKSIDYDVLRIESGTPAFGTEFTATTTDDTAERRPANPVEFHIVPDMEKGCYLGQEGVATMVKNKRGPPRTLYNLVFDNAMNLYSSDDGEKMKNKTCYPKQHHELFVLGSNEQIKVGTITSVGVSDGAGDNSILGLCLVRRPDTILRAMTKMQLDLPASSADSDLDDGMILPPPMDALHNLEVIIGGAYTIGKLQSIPSRLYYGTTSRSMYSDENVVPSYVVNDIPEEEETNDLVSVGIKRSESPVSVSIMPSSSSAENTIETGSKSDDDDEAAVEAEIQRKKENMALLKARTDEAMARRQKAVKKESNDDEDGAAERKRKEEKMELLQARAKAAMARRKQGNE